MKRVPPRKTFFNDGVHCSTFRSPAEHWRKHCFHNTGPYKQGASQILPDFPVSCRFISFNDETTPMVFPQKYSHNQKLAHKVMECMAATGKLLPVRIIWPYTSRRNIEEQNTRFQSRTVLISSMASAAWCAFDVVLSSSMPCTPNKHQGIIIHQKSAKGDSQCIAFSYLVQRQERTRHVLVIPFHVNPVNNPRNFRRDNSCRCVTTR